MTSGKADHARSAASTDPRQQTTDCATEAAGAEKARTTHRFPPKWVLLSQGSEFAANDE
jgi:hypothetical protein